MDINTPESGRISEREGEAFDAIWISIRVGIKVRYYPAADAQAKCGAYLTGLNIPE